MNRFLQLLIISFILFFANIYAQSKDALFISEESLMTGTFYGSFGFYLAAPSSLPVDEIKWRYSPGDDTLWAEPNYDDSKWELVDPWMDMLKPEAEKWNGIGWFRKVIKIDSTLLNKTIGAYIHQDGASEIYLNGKKIFEFGKVSKNKADEEFFDPFNTPFVFSFDSNTVYTIAVRYSNHSHLGWEYFYNKFFSHLGFSISIFDFNNNIKSELVLKQERTSTDWGINGFTLAFSLIFFLLYFFYLKQKQNLYFALFVFGIFLMSASTDLQFIGNPALKLVAIYRIVQFIAFSLVFTFFLLFIYESVYKRIIKLFWLFLTAFIVINVFAFFGTVGIFDNIMPFAIVIAIMTIESIRVFVIGIIRKVNNIWILSVGAILFLVFVLGQILIIPQLPETVLESIASVTMVLTITILPIFMAIYLAKSYGKTQSDLEEKIVTVQELSDKQIEQERQNAELKLMAQLERAENERKTKELDQARKLQLSMLPKEIPTLPNLDIAVYMKTATEVGGDYYDFHLSDKNTLTAVVGDATGHGLNAGMLVSVSKGLFLNLSPQPDLDNIISQFNNSLISMKLQPMYMSLHFLRISNNQLQVVGAGMPPILYYQSSTKNIIEIESGGPPLGGFPNFKYELYNYELFKGDIILVLTDGIAERMNVKKQIFGWDKGKKLLFNMKDLSANEIIREIIKINDEWAENKEQEDDITMVALKVK
ncbi:MAG: SpoIIE family protein phosphatase [Ignavibacteriales bacterium]|nr:SpoIIE family protein phosphatase [Ignavibacteriales bacterium]